MDLFTSGERETDKPEVNLDFVLFSVFVFLYLDYGDWYKRTLKLVAVS